MGAHMKKKVLPVIVAILLILVIGGCALGKVLLDKYSYSKEEADWNEFCQRTTGVPLFYRMKWWRNRH